VLPRARCSPCWGCSWLSRSPARPSRFEARRFYIDSEANAIGTAYLRLDLLAEESQRHCGICFDAYADNR
jgi:hypothetical protein